MTDQPPTDELQAYFQNAGSWAEDRRRLDIRSRQAAWWIAGVAVVIALAEAIAMAALAPLKTVVPMAVLVDRQTGYVTTVDPNQSVNIQADSALTRSMLAQYVMARETLDRASVSADYRKVALWSGGNARQQYLAQMAPNHPANPYQSLPPNSSSVPVIRSVSTLDDGSAMVRFDMVGQSANVGPVLTYSYVALLRYGYRKRNLRDADRLINPLGFEVTSYRKDAEAPPSPVAAGVAGQAARPAGSAQP